VNIRREQRATFVGVVERDRIEIPALSVTRDVTQEISAANAVWDASPCGRGQRPPQARRVPIEPLDVRMWQVPLVPTEELVAAIPGQNDRDVLAARRDTYQVGMAETSANGSSKCQIS
jgi:hypothetical protein